MASTIQLATSDADILRCRPVLLELRPHLSPAETDFLALIRSQQAEGYHMAFLDHEGTVTTVAGFRTHLMTFSGKTLYVDDLVSAAAARSLGHGKAMIAWVTERARATGCLTLSLDSGCQRVEAHSFYFRQGLRVTDFHFQTVYATAPKRDTTTQQSAASTIRLATSDADILRCLPVLRELRPHLSGVEADFLALIRAQQAEGYHMAFLEHEGAVSTVAGFRTFIMSFSGKTFYIDDLVTSSAARSLGHGKAIVAWLSDSARADGCATFSLDSGCQRLEAHNFYYRQGLRITAFHFEKTL